MNFKLKKIDNPEKYYEKSKICGSPIFPKDFFKENKLENDLFVAQINLEDINNNLVPNSGYLHFFLDVSSYPYKAKVFYTIEEAIEVYDNINEGFEDFGETIGYEIIETNIKTGLFLFSEFDGGLELDSIINTDDLIVLLELDNLELPPNVLTLGNPDGWDLFVIHKNDLEKLNFSKVEFLSYGS